jgi:hypothetical protein
VAARRNITGELRAEETLFGSILTPGIPPETWPLVTTEEPATVVASALWVNGQPAQGGLAGRLALAHNSMFGTEHAPVLIAVGIVTAQRAMTAEEQQESRRMIARFLSAQTALPATVERLSREAASGPRQ